MKITTRELTLIPLFCTLTIIGAYLRIPFPLAPLTMQTFFVLLSAIVLGPVNAAIAQFLYLFIGLAGIPVFTGGGGIGYIFNPTFGFILSFIPMAYVSGHLYKRSHNILAGAAGFFVCYLIGVPYLYIILNYHLDMQKTIWDVLTGAMLIFIPGDILKIILAGYLLDNLKKRTRWLFTG